MFRNQPFPRKNYFLGFVMLLSLFIGGCFVPKTVTEIENKCELSTKKLTLDLSKEGTAGAIKAMGAMFEDCSGEECLYIVPIVIVGAPVASLTLSGSIVVIGNTIHWLEKQGRCDDSVTRQTMRDFMKSMKKAGGKVIHTGKEFSAWLKGDSS